MKISGWGRHPVLDCRLQTLRRLEDLPRFLHAGETLIARGNGRSYGDAALNSELTLSMRAMDRMQAFDERTGLLTCEAGVLLADILKTFVPRGWFPPVAPGTQFVTLGGMIAADVHGKNHHLDGSFGAHLQSLTLALADGEVATCSRTQHGDLFRATLGGMGLTGVILSASFRLRPIETAFLLEETLSAANLEETMRLFEASQDWPYSVAWVDGLARGAKLGRSVLSRGRFLARAELPQSWAENPLRPAAPARLKAPMHAPFLLLNRTSASLFNALYFRRAAGDARPIPLQTFFFPLDRIEDWNRIYGRRGFVQHQSVLPKSESQAGLAALLARAAEWWPGSFLAVLKLFGPGGDGLLSFPMEGYSLALDFPMNDGTPALLAELDAIVGRHGGRVYLAKDSCWSPELLRQGYAQLEQFNAMRSEAAGEPPRFASALARRLAL